MTTHVSPRRRFLRRFLFWSCFAGGLGLAVGYVRFATALSVTEAGSPPRTDAIVVVTGGAQRIGDAISLLNADRGRRLLISGVNEKTGRDELAKLNPTAREALACCVDLDYRARNTIGNAIEARRWVRRHDFRSLLVVTSNYHMPRTLLELEHAMPGVRFVPHPVVTDQVDVAGWWRDWHAIRLLVPEYLKYLVAGVRSKLETDPETSRLSVIIGGRKPVSPKPGDQIGPEHDKRSRAASPARGA
ncbi:YdcF family protein [Bosea sp. LjRoot90]|uniref:YdcF family protein n=1 Tax=Bosea sp. LjRoot90 TaxID=3342342 RepID=UPI003ED07C12